MRFLLKVSRLLMSLALCQLMCASLLAKVQAVELFEQYCFNCHGDDVHKGNVNMASLFGDESFDGTLMFENLITAKMPPKNKKAAECTGETCDAGLVGQAPS